MLNCHDLHVVHEEHFTILNYVSWSHEWFEIMYKKISSRCAIAFPFPLELYCPTSTRTAICYQNSLENGEKKMLKQSVCTSYFHSLKIYTKNKCENYDSTFLYCNDTPFVWRCPNLHDQLMFGAWLIKTSLKMNLLIRCFALFGIIILSSGVFSLSSPMIPENRNIRKFFEYTFLENLVFDSKSNWLTIAQHPFWNSVKKTIQI